MILFKPKVDQKKEELISLIRRRRRQILVHSCLYYKMSTNIISDEQFDKWCAELRDLHAKNPQLMDCGVFDKEFKKWGGYSGFDLPTYDPDIMRKAEQLIRIKKEMETMDDEYSQICKAARTNIGPNS